ncbi:hypothetical protein F5H01DRAFT_11515 [Linnemannia elongata]|nr:hypothetical protein F5H01DRAFT_11515 [Linnemannia elongata]
MIMLDEHTLFRCLSTPCGLSSFLPPLSRRKASSRLSWSSLDSLPPALPHRLILTVLFFFYQHAVTPFLCSKLFLILLFFLHQKQKQDTLYRTHPPTNTTPDILFFFFLLSFPSLPESKQCPPPPSLSLAQLSSILPFLLYKSSRPLPLQFLILFNFLFFILHSPHSHIPFHFFFFFFFFYNSDSFEHHFLHCLFFCPCVSFPFHQLLITYPIAPFAFTTTRHHDNCNPLPQT